MLHCGDKGWGLTTTKRHVDDYRYLANIQRMENVSFQRKVDRFKV